MKSKHIKEIKAAFVKANIELIELDQTGKHPKVTVVFNGKTVKYPLSNSPSDVNWIRQNVRKIKRAAA